MEPSHQQALYIMIGLIGLIVIAIFTPFILKSFKKKDQDVSQIEVSAGEFTEALKVAEEESQNLRTALKSTEANIFGRLRGLFSAGRPSPELEEIEEVLYTSDLGPKTVEKLMVSLRENLNSKEKNQISTIREVLRKEMTQIFDVTAKLDEQVHWAKEGPTVIMIVGVNGAGKTTSIGKLSAQWAQMGHKVLVAAGDTFRAAAGAQLQAWTERAQVEIFSPAGVTDPAAVAFDAISKAKAQGFDIVLVDTAGRLHTQAPLMEELKKVKRVMAKVVLDAPHETLIVLDANSGQNALVQAREFHQALGLSGAILTKMDGTAKGGIAVGLANELKIPIKYIGVGEKIRDLRAFSSSEFIDSIVGEAP